MKRLEDHIHNDYTNRVADAIYLYAEQETQHKISNPLASRNSEDISLKLQYYGSIYEAFKKNANREEKLSLRFVKHEMAKMKARLNPTSLNRILYSDIANILRNFANGNNLFYATHHNSIKSIEKDLIQQHNILNLSHEMKKAGFKQEIEGALTKIIRQDLPQFHVRYADVQNNGTDFVLHFKKIPSTNIYYFEKFDAVSRPSLDALLSNDPSCTRHTFSVNGKIKFNAKEAANLVNGKAVCKSINGKDTWLMLDAVRTNQQSSFKHISFDLEKVLQKLPIKQLDNPVHAKSLLDALKTGSQKEVTFIVHEQPVKYNIEAAPLQKTINILDKENRLINAGKLLSGKMQGVTEKLVNKINQQEDVIDLGQQHRQKRKAI